ncbi:hypothetical protein K488DRAFT_67929 [Vararia minispora EC-137]|uniref:Uncharacterized protein n=1 Tax=Vararia minispora EC-137 TaxID=1314806 RepID=A0ACB8QXE8_9AGAM|nr:hypothetical protein K488DRAFT_67929 [Vararia minispora EC-137]
MSTALQTQIRTRTAPRTGVPSPGSNFLLATSKVASSPRLAAQFKSPLQSRADGEARAGILPTAAIQALERKLHILKRAVKIKHSNEEEKLEGLALKWRDAAREAAYELWTIVRETTAVQGLRSSTTSAWAGGWGWDEDDQEGKGDDVALREREQSEEEEPERQEHTLGTMLRRLNIDPQTLGWDDADECFAD